MKKRALSLLLASVLSLYSLAFLASCRDEGAEETQETQTDAGTSSDTEYRFGYIDEYVDSLAEDCEFDGANFSILTDTDWRWPTEDEETGVLEDDAIYARNREIEEKFDIDLVVHMVDGTGGDFEYAPHEAADRLKTDVMANMSSYDLVLSSIMICGVASLGNGVIRPVEEVEGLDLSKSWWMRDIYDQFSINDSLYFLTGKAAESHYSAPQCILFNKNLMEDYGITENLYSLVESGDWTVDRMNEIASVVPQGGEHFRYLHGGNIGGLAFYFGAGYRVCETDENYNPVIPSALTSDQTDYINHLETIFGDTSVARDEQKWSQENDFPDGYEIFAEDIYLFSQEWIGTVPALRNFEVKFGVVPIPKRTAEQKDYYAFASAWGIGGLFFPSDISDEMMTGYITEAMAALSEKHLEPAYYEKSLKGRGTYDLESRDMLDIIYSSVVIDLSDIYQDQWGSLIYVINDGVVGYTDTLTSSYNSSAKVANNQINRLIRQLKKREK